MVAFDPIIFQYSFKEMLVKVPSKEELIELALALK